MNKFDKIKTYFLDALKRGESKNPFENVKRKGLSKKGK